MQNLPFSFVAGDSKPQHSEAEGHGLDIAGLLELRMVNNNLQPFRVSFCSRLALLASPRWLIPAPTRGTVVTAKPGRRGIALPGGILPEGVSAP